MHEIDPTVAATLPASHAVQVELASEVEWKPSEQLVHDDALVRLYLPATQCEQFTAPARLTVPASQAEQLGFPGVLAEVPSAQSSHAI